MMNHQVTQSYPSKRWVTWGTIQIQTNSQKNVMNSICENLDKLNIYGLNLIFLIELHVKINQQFNYICLNFIFKNIFILQSYMVDLYGVLDIHI